MTKRKANRRHAKRYPPLPTEVPGAGGMLEVRLVRAPGGSGGEENMGHFDGATRTIEILSTLRGDQRWMVLFHELAHAALWDCGVHNGLAGPLEEMVCDAIATARLREKFP